MRHLVSLLFFLAASAHSAELINHVSGEQLTYDIVAQSPTENVDGTPLTDLSKLTLYSCQGEGCSPTNFRDDYPVTETGVDVVMTRTFAPTGDVGTTQIIRYAATASDSDDPPNESAYSNVKEYRITFVEPVTVPVPPLIAPANSPAYIIVQSEDALVLLDVGRIGEDTQCSAEVSITDDNGVLAYKVPSAAVTPYNATQQLVVTFARCGS